MTTLAPDLRYAFRTLAKSRGFTVVAVLTLALGIGANTAIFSVLDAVLFKPLPFPEANRLVALFPRRGNEPLGSGAISPPEYADIAERQKAFEGVAAIRDRAVNLTGGGEAERLQTFAVTPNLPQVLHLQPALGRGFLPEEGRKGAPRVVMLGHDRGGHVAAALSARVLRSLLFEVSPTDTGTFVAAALLLLAVASFAALLPAWRAVRVDPLVALRQE